MIKTFSHLTFYLLVIFLCSNTLYGKTFKFASLSPEGSDWMQKMRSGAKEINERTEGRVKFKFYPGGVMGDDQAVLRKIRIGQLHGGALAGGSIIKANSDYRIFSLLLTYKNQGEINYIRKHIDPIIKQGFENGGFVILGMAESGFAYAMSSKAPITAIEQLRQQKVWSPSNDRISQETLQSFGVTPIPLPYGDVLAGLQTGLIDTVAMSPIGAIALQWYTQIKYITDMPLLYSLGILTINQKAFKKIKPKDQIIVREVMSKAFDAIETTNRKNNLEALDVLKNSGIEFVKPSETEYSNWQQFADKANKNLVESGNLDAKLVNKVQHLLNDYRK
ncbi:MAG: TRAP transporter substrate-binding protein DctP [Gammaproteobacteria bacterium]|nr:TRAP transporter substrate-binding protein DctP [Gammaproteobacteria bacterium]